MNRILLKLFSVAVILYIGLKVIIGFYFLSYEIVNYIEPNAYYRYATNGAYDEDVYFKKPYNENIDIVKSVDEVIGNKQGINRKQDIFKELLQNENLFRKKIYENKKYNKYLNDNNLEIDGLINYIKKLAVIDNLMLSASAYVVILICIFVYYSLFKSRNEIYIAAAILYFILVLDSFLSGILSSIFYPFFSKNLNYEQYVTFINTILPAFKEATLTYIIVDTVIQHYVDRRNKHIDYRIKEAYYSLEKVLIGLQTIGEKPINITIKVIHVDFEFVKHFCTKHKNDYYLCLAQKQITENNNIVLSGSEPLKIYESIEPVYSNLKKSKTLANIIIP